jgi:hypothetical protein
MLVDPDKEPLAEDHDQLMLAVDKDRVDQDQEPSVHHKAVGARDNQVNQRLETDGSQSDETANSNDDLTRRQY